MTHRHRRTRRPDRGMTLIELLSYVFILTVLLAIVVYALMSLGSSWRTMQSAAAVESAAQIALERMSRDIRDAKSIDIAQSTFNASPGVLLLNTTDAGGATTTVQFLVSGQTIHVKEAGIDIGPLTASGVRITNLVFRRIITAQSQAVKIEMTVESGEGANYRSASLFDTSVLRGSYPTQ